MTDTTTPTPALSARTRTAVYLAGLVVAGVVLLVSGLAAIWAPEYADRVAASAGVIGSTAALITGGLGVAYRPR